MDVGWWQARTTCPIQVICRIEYRFRINYLIFFLKSGTPRVLMCNGCNGWCVHHTLFTPCGQHGPSQQVWR